MEYFGSLNDITGAIRSVNDAKITAGTIKGIAQGQDPKQSVVKAQASLFAAAIGSAHPDEKTVGSITPCAPGIKMSLSETKGAICYTLDDKHIPGFAAFVPIATSLVRGILISELRTFVLIMVKFIEVKPIPNLSLVMQFLAYTRSIRAFDKEGGAVPCPGKGERDIYFSLVYHLWKEYFSQDRSDDIQHAFIQTVYHISVHYGCILDIIKLIKKFGTEPFFKDKLVNLLVEDIKPYMNHWIEIGKPTSPSQTNSDDEETIHLAIQQVKFLNLKFNDTPQVRWKLLFKWLPRYKSQYHDVAKLLQKELDVNKPEYRKCVAYYTWLSGIVERLMSGNRWDEINHPSVPSGAVYKNRLAFQNKKRGTQNIELTRYPDDPKRQKCAKNFYEALENGSLRLGSMDIVQLIRLMNSNDTSMANLSANQIVKAIKKDTLKLCAGDEIKAKEQLLMLAICDLSESMTTLASGTTKNVRCKDIAIALSVLVSMLSSVLKDKVLIFAEHTQWVTFEPEMEFAERCIKLRNNNCGYTTNFHNAIQGVLDVMKKLKIPASNFPKLVVFTDMMYNDRQCGGGMTQTMYTQFMNMLTSHSKHVCEMVEIEFDPDIHVRPLQIAHCNLAARSAELSTSTSAKGTQFIGGFSPKIMMEIIIGRVEAAKKKEETTPEQSLKSSLQVFAPVGKYFVDLVHS